MGLPFAFNSLSTKNINLQIYKFTFFTGDYINNSFNVKGISELIWRSFRFNIGRNTSSNNGNFQKTLNLPPVDENTNKNHQTDKSQCRHDDKGNNGLLLRFQPLSQTNTRLMATITGLCSRRKLRELRFKMEK